MGGGQKALYLSVFPQFSIKGFLTFNFNPFATLLQNFKAIPSVSSKLLNLNQKHPQKNCFFWLNPYKIEVMITCLIETLMLPNYGHMTTSTIEFQ